MRKKTSFPTEKAKQISAAAEDAVSWLTLWRFLATKVLSAPTGECTRQCSDVKSWGAPDKMPFSQTFWQKLNILQEMHFLGRALSRKSDWGVNHPSVKYIHCIFFRLKAGSKTQCTFITKPEGLEAFPENPLKVSMSHESWAERTTRHLQSEFLSVQPQGRCAIPDNRVFNVAKEMGSQILGTTGNSFVIVLLFWRFYESMIKARTTLEYKGLSYPVYAI